MLNQHEPESNYPDRTRADTNQHWDRYSHAERSVRERSAQGPRQGSGKADGNGGDDQLRLCAHRVLGLSLLLCVSVANLSLMLGRFRVPGGGDASSASRC